MQLKVQFASPWFWGGVSVTVREERAEELGNLLRPGTAALRTAKAEVRCLSQFDRVAFMA